MADLFGKPEPKFRIEFTDHHGARVLLDPKKYPFASRDKCERTIKAIRRLDPPWLGSFKVIDAK